MFLTSPVMQTAKMQSVSSWLLSLGLVFSVATQLRLPGLPLGLGEVLLLLWLLTSLVSANNWRSPVLAGVLALTLVGALLLSTGYFVTTYPAGHTRPAAPALHDALAYAFCAVLAINYARLADKYENSLPAVLLWVFLLSTLLALLLGVITRDWSGMDVMYYHTRWQHLSNNPNQFALLVLPFPFLALHLILRQSEKQDLFMPMLIGLLALGLGWYSQSDALTLAWMGGGLVAALALYGKRPARLISKQYLEPHARIIATLLVLLMVTGSAWQWRDVAAQIILGTGTGTGACNQGLVQNLSVVPQNQISIRLCLWRNGLGAIQYAPLTGLGPGPHSGLVEPFEGEEAHNTLLDWGTQTGLVGMVVLLAYLLWLLWQVARQRQYELVAMLLALYGFAMFGDYLRQPLFWIMPLLGLELAARSRVSGSDTELKK